MNKKKYKDTFSQIHPSEQTVERIIDMTQRKQRIICKPVLIAVAVALTLLVMGGIVAVAKADNGIANSVINWVKNEKETVAKVLKDTSYINHKGETVREVEVELDDGTKTGFKTVNSGETSAGKSKTYMICEGKDGCYAVGIDEDGNVVSSAVESGADMTAEKLDEVLSEIIEEE